MSYLRQYADHVLKGKLDTLVETLREQGLGWEAVAKEIWRVTGHKVNLSGQTLRGWYGPMARQKSA